MMFLQAVTPANPWVEIITTTGVQLVLILGVILPFLFSIRAKVDGAASIAAESLKVANQEIAALKLQSATLLALVEKLGAHKAPIALPTADAHTALPTSPK